MSMTTASRASRADGPIRVGVIGCGTIAQIAHLPFLKELRDRFTISALCDVVPGTLHGVGEAYGVPRQARFEDYRELCASDLVDAVMVCHNGSHVPPATAALQAGKSVIIEKPLCSRLDEAEALVAVAREARERSGAVAMMAYMKQFDPGFQYARRLLRPRLEQGDIRYVDARHIHARNPLYEAHHTLIRGEIPESLRQGRTGGGSSGAWEQIGPDPSPAQRRVLSGIGSSIHDVYCLRALLGRPEAVLASEVYESGRAALFRYPRGVLVNYAWIDVGPVRNFRQEFVCYGSDLHLAVRFPQPYLLSAPTTVTVNTMEPAPDLRDQLGDPSLGGLSPQHHGQPLVQAHVTASYQDAYKLEWVHFHACITQGLQPLATIEDARDDTAFFVEWARATRPAA
ncbi:MAG TPA: Gfo/Idh/MocA family oxidoreductase [Chloroflexota bacterium]|nr:Gfo/Idh/MocA family oxidoreductase [Chloroflexota bacterium]